jgi:hypothetical protein
VKKSFRLWCELSVPPDTAGLKACTTAVSSLPL